MLGAALGALLHVGMEGRSVETATGRTLVATTTHGETCTFGEWLKTKRKVKNALHDTRRGLAGALVLGEEFGSLLALFVCAGEAAEGSAGSLPFQLGVAVGLAIGGGVMSGVAFAGDATIAFCRGEGAGEGTVGGRSFDGSMGHGETLL